MTDDLEVLKGQLEELRWERDDLKERNEALKERNETLKEAVDEGREYVADARQAIDNYRAFILEPAEADGFVQSRIGTVIDEHNALVEKYEKLRRRYNRLVQDWNRAFIPTAPGRPIDASDEQQNSVRRLRKKGRSLRGIASDTSLSFRTVRSIVGHMSGASDKAKRDRLKRERELGRLRQADARARKRAKDALVTETKRLLKDGERLQRPAEG